MLILITGGSASGKSAFAEETAMAFGETQNYYVATMYNYGDKETNNRINRHREMRKDKGFTTVECPMNLQDVMINDGTVLLECLSNLVANEIFINKSQNTENKIFHGIEKLKSKNLVIVTNEIFSDSLEYDTETENYLKILGNLNCKVAELADEVYEVVYGIPIKMKK